MTLVRKPMSEVPASVKPNSLKYPREQLLDAIEGLKAGESIQSDKPFKRASRARYAALVLRKQIMDQNGEFEDGLQPSTTVWEEPEDVFHFAVILREPT